MELAERLGPSGWGPNVVSQHMDKNLTRVHGGMWGYVEDEEGQPVMEYTESAHDSRRTYYPLHYTVACERKSDRARVAADLLENNGFDDIANVLRMLLSE